MKHRWIRRLYEEALTVGITHISMRCACTDRDDLAVHYPDTMFIIEEQVTLHEVYPMRYVVKVLGSSQND